MSKYIYPAIFAKNELGGYCVSFPDVKGCYTQGDDLQDAYDMAKDALCLMLYDIEEDSKDIPPASDISAIKTSDGEFVSLVSCDTLTYKRYYDRHSVKKTLTIPAWLNTMAEREGINFSSVLQSALKKKLCINGK